MKNLISFSLLIVFVLTANAENTNPGPLRLTVTPMDLSVSGTVNYKGFTRRCDRFINPAGQLGDWGQALQSAVQRVGQGCFFNQADFSTLCPNFRNFDNQRKMQFLAFMFGTLAYDESSCMTNANAQGPNGIADGLFQLEYSRRLRARSGRDRVFCVTDRGVNTQNITFQMECTASIFRDGFCRRDRVPGRDFWYWEKLNGRNKVVSQNVMRFPHCGN